MTVEYHHQLLTHWKFGIHSVLIVRHIFDWIINNVEDEEE